MTYKHIKLMKEYLLANGYKLEQVINMSVTDIQELYEELRR